MYDQLEQIIESTDRDLLEPARKDALSVLFISVRGYACPISIETVIGQSLRVRGARVNYVLCDRLLPKCEGYDVDHNRTECNKNCFEQGSRFLKSVDLPYHVFSEYISADDRKVIETMVREIAREEAFSYEYKGVDVGEYALSSVLRYYKRGTFDDADEEQWKTLYEYLVSACMVTFATGRMFDELKPDRLVISQGFYVSWGPIYQLARKRNIPMYTYILAERAKCIYIQHNDVGVYSGDFWEHLEGRPYEKEHEGIINEYLYSRRTGANDLIAYNAGKEEISKETIFKKLSISDDKMILALFTNVVWDAAALGQDDVFADQIEWFKATLTWLMKRDDVHVLIKVHPSEVVKGLETRQSFLEVIAKEFPLLPGHIHVVEPDTGINTYSFLDIVDVGLCYTTTVGLELATMGKPAVVAGRAHYRSKGFTYDPCDKETYFRVVEQLIENPAQQVNAALAKKYAYNLYFRKYLNFDFLKYGAGLYDVVGLNIDSLSDLLPGRHQHLDVICDSIMDNKDVFDRE